MPSVLADRRYLIPFRATLLPQIFTDVLVIGSGVAGMRAAAAAAEAMPNGDVIVTGKGKLEQSNTYWAQGGVAAVLDPNDTVDDHVQDTLIAGAGLCDEPAVRAVVEEGAEEIANLQSWGMRFDYANGRDSGELALGKEGGHSAARIVHTDGDSTGKTLAECMRAKLNQTPRIRCFDECFVLDLITVETSPPQCLGAITHHPDYGLQVIWASATILACGGAGQIYRESTNPRISTGDGIAMAYRAGAKLMDMSFMQFHPTTLYVAGASRALVTEAVRGEGAYLLDKNEQRFMQDYDPRGELAPRDIVSRSILSQLVKTGFSHVYLDVRHFPEGRFAQRFPGILKLLEKFDIDPTQDLIPVHPSAHYMVGGVQTDHDGRTSLLGLFAAGEVAASGLHGANRLASNSLLEGLVFGKRAGLAAAKMANDTTPHNVKVISDIPLSDKSELDLHDVRSSLRSVMWRHVGIERQGDHLDEVKEMFDFWGRYTMDKIFDERLGWEVQNMLTVGALLTRAAAWRTESRGTHYRIDYPEPKEAMRVHDVWVRGEDEPTTVAVDSEAIQTG